MSTDSEELAREVDDHSFVRHPHRTLLSLSIPVLFSLVAEPFTGLADTAFVARLGPTPVAALGVATALLSSVFWIFNFLGIGTQTEVARALGTGHRARGRQSTTLALVLGGVLGVALALIALPGLGAAAAFMGATGGMRDGAVVYLRIRLLGAPAVLITASAFGALRGVQDMRTPLWVAVTVNAVNVVLDALLIFGIGPFPALGLAGAAWATTASQWAGAAWAVLALRHELGLSAHVRWRDAVDLLVVGRDLFLRTAALLLFILLATRVATRIGADGGAAHQAIRQVWIFTALLLDAYAATAQSLVGYFLGASRIELARRVAGVACLWGVATGAALALLMIAGGPLVERVLVPPAAWPLFTSAWIIAAAAQPLNALSFVTDGVHWGTGDYAYLRNGMIAATAIGAAGLSLIDVHAPGALTQVWLVTAVWIAARTAVGSLRIWPALGHAPLASSR